MSVFCVRTIACSLTILTAAWTGLAKPALAAFEDGIRACEDEGRLKSPPRGTPPMRITFRDNMGQVIHLYWLDSDGRRVPYGTLGDQQAKSFDTFVRHVWVATDSRGECVEVVVASRETSDVVIPSGD